MVNGISLVLSLLFVGHWVVAVILVVFDQNRLIFKAIRGITWLESSLQGTSMVERGGRKFIFFVGGSLDLLKVRDLKMVMFCKKCELEICGKTYSNGVARITRSGCDIKPIQLISII